MKDNVMYKPYRFRTALWDLFWICCTAGFWLFWMLIREIRRSKKLTSNKWPYRMNQMPGYVDNRKFYS